MNIHNSEEPDEILEAHDSQAPPPASPSRLKKWVREPLIHFFVLGLAVFLLHAALDRETEAPDSNPFVVEVSSADIEWMRTIFSKRMGREPTLEELRGQVHQLIREQILSREAVAMGLDEGDMVVRRRLTQKMEFLLKDLSDMAEPTEEDLRSYFTENQSNYGIPARISFSQVYFSIDNRGVEKSTQAVNALIQENLDPAQGSNRGDASMIAPGCRQCTETDIRSQFGTEFAAKVINLNPGSWYGPVRSAYGIHAVYIHDRQGASSPVFHEVMEEVKSDLMLAREEEHRRKVYAEVRSRYRVMLEGLPYDGDVNK